MKQCRKCLVEKPLDCFSKTLRGVLGVDCYCKPCRNIHSRENYSKNRERRIEQSKEYRKNHIEQYKKWKKEWYLNNREYARSQSRKYFLAASPERKAMLRLGAAKFYMAHPEAIANKNLRRASPKIRVAWANAFFIEEIYRLSALRTKCLRIKHEVDHIVPIKNKLVCGLHNEFNLAVITRSDNASKGNRWWPDMP